MLPQLMHPVPVKSVCEEMIPLYNLAPEITDPSSWMMYLDEYVLDSEMTVIVDMTVMHYLLMSKTTLDLLISMYMPKKYRVLFVTISEPTSAPLLHHMYIRGLNTVTA
jgi:hypothetical protein